MELLAESLGIKGELNVEALCQGWGKLESGRDVHGDRLAVGDRAAAFGLGTHADSRIRVTAAVPLKRFRAFAGVAVNDFTRENAALICPLDFAVEADGALLRKEANVAYGDVVEFDVPLDGRRCFDLTVTAKFSHAAHVNWGEPCVETVSGEILKLGGGERVFPNGLPVDFLYGEMSAAAFLEKYGLTHTVEGHGGFVCHTFVSEAPELRMELSCRQYTAYPVLEFQLDFRNPSQTRRSKQLSNVRSLRFKCSDGGRSLAFCRRHGAWDYLTEPPPDSFRQSFRAVSQEAAAGDQWRFGATEGRPSSEWLPCFDVVLSENTWRFVIGWSGQWCAQAAYEGGVFEAEAGLQDFDAYLEPGERFTMPSLFVQFTKGGGMEESVNIWRRFAMRHLIAMPDGERPCAPVSIMSWGGMPEVRHLEKLAIMEREHVPMETYWIDAGWFAPESRDEHDSAWFMNVGNWTFNPGLFPNGLKNVAEEVHRMAARLLLWVEPERARIDSPLAKEHPEYFLFNNSMDALLNLGDKKAWEYCLDMLASLVRENGLDWLRWDFNCSPRPYWLANDAPGRAGVTEVKYVEGLRMLWKRLKELFPALMIDNCASGGRRLDVELLRYSIPLWHSDMNCFADFRVNYALTHLAGLAEYWPVFACGTQNKNGGDTARFRALLASGIDIPFFYSSDACPETYPYQWLRNRIGEFLAVRDCLAGDFYCLAEPSLDERNMAVLQFQLPEEGRGCILAVRGENCPEISRRIILKGLISEKRYRLADCDGSFTPLMLSGSELMDGGFVLEIREAGVARLMTINEG